MFKHLNEEPGSCPPHNINVSDRKNGKQIEDSCKPARKNQTDQVPAYVRPATWDLRALVSACRPTCQLLDLALPWWRSSVDDPKKIKTKRFPMRELKLILLRVLIGDVWTLDSAQFPGGHNPGVRVEYLIQKFPLIRSSSSSSNLVLLSKSSSRRCRHNLHSFMCNYLICVIAQPRNFRPSQSLVLLVSMCSFFLQQYTYVILRSRHNESTSGGMLLFNRPPSTTSQMQELKYTYTNLRSKCRSRNADIVKFLDEIFQAYQLHSTSNRQQPHLHHGCLTQSED